MNLHLFYLDDVLKSDPSMRMPRPDYTFYILIKFIIIIIIVILFKTVPRYNFHFILCMVIQPSRSCLTAAPVPHLSTALYSAIGPLEVNLIVA